MAGFVVSRGRCLHALTGICNCGYIAAMPSSPWSALADPNRRAMLALMLERPRAVNELVERLGLSQPGTSKHLRVLREAGLVQGRRGGRGGGGGAGGGAAGRARAGAAGGAAAGLCAGAGAAGRARRVARAVPAVVERQPGCAGAAPGRNTGGRDMSAHGSFETVDGGPAVVFERSLAHPVEAVWRAVTEPAGLAHWFPSSVEVELREGGRMRFVHADGGAPPAAGEVLELDPPRRLTFTWGEERLRFELEPAGEDRTRLRLTHFLSTREQAARDAA